MKAEFLAFVPSYSLEKSFYSFTKYFFQVFFSTREAAPPKEPKADSI
jgi:hypothetical protein